MNKKSEKHPNVHTLIEDGKLLYCPCRSKPWKYQLEKLYTEFRAEDDREPPKEIIPFDNERIVRILATNGKPITDKDFIAYGMATLVLCNHGTGTGYIGHVEDVFVSRDFRRQGISENLMRTLIEKARVRDLIYLELTSNPKWSAAHELYEKVGFRMIAKAVPRKDAGNRATDLFRLPLRTI
jgi:GNAT superfamily N-acetyltransferase